jgi:hypothetical protein
MNQDRESNKDFNPYEVRESMAVEEVLSHANKENRFELIVVWIFMSLINTIAPGLFASNLVSDDAFIGVYLGVACIVGVGCIVTYCFPVPMKRILYGAILTALSQFFPVMQMLFGLVTYSFIQWVGFRGVKAEHVNEIQSPYIAFVMTALVALELITVALIAGIFLKSLGYLFKLRNKPNH